MSIPGVNANPGKAYTPATIAAMGATWTRTIWHWEADARTALQSFTTTCADTGVEVIPIIGSEALGPSYGPGLSVAQVEAVLREETQLPEELFRFAFVGNEPDNDP